MNKNIAVFFFFALTALLLSCSNNKPMKFTGAKAEIMIMTLDPGHFHAALVQKTMIDQLDSNVYVFAPEGEDLKEHIKRINGYNSRKENPTRWKEITYTGPDFFEKMIKSKPGNLLVIAGNNRKKTEYIKASIDAGINILADKPMAIDVKNFELLKDAFGSARQNGVLLYDIMTERFEISTILQKELSLQPEIFGTLEQGTPENPAVTKESVHHFYKYVSGSALKRPAWFFDVDQQGQGIVDVTTHLVDLVQWECFPEQIIDYTKDIKIISAKRWATKLNPSEFNIITKLKEYPVYLKKDLHDTILQVYSNGEINYSIKGVHARVSVIWNYKAPEGAGDTHFSVMRGTKANLVIRQGKDQGFKPVLYVEPLKGVDMATYVKSLEHGIQKLSAKYEGISLRKLDKSWEIYIPDKLRVGHEAHFVQVTEKFLQYLIAGKLPEWEVPNMIAKYYTTTKALEMAVQEK